ncbi:Type III secretion protein HrpZ (plasmid) [Pseudomonas antarctica]|uniref:Type III secretion protein HrpZ n=1 Tax=Pseudomonas antarctica TaxID=219572 RepID=A0A172ZA73_9PSED|nr:hypothetical protein [Pseudomonas antarctica]ANF89252.1 Type III secretion protein HrpZ [Pseudomonas antarctica]
MENSGFVNSAALHIGTVIPGDGTFQDLAGSKTPQALNGVVDRITNALTSSGHLDTDTPLGKMVEQQLKKDNPFAALGIGQSADNVRKAVSDLIKNTLGNNFGASASAGIGGGQDLMSQIMKGLGKAALNQALTPEGDGSTFSNADKPLLRKVADFMDDNKSAFGTPDSGSWRKELNEDNYLSKDETSKFRAALEQISQQMDGSDSVSGSAVPQSTAGGLSSPPNDLQNDASDDDALDDSGTTTQGGLGTPQASPDNSGSDDSADSADAPAANSQQQLQQILQQLEQLLGAASGMQGAQQGGHHHHHDAQSRQMQDRNQLSSAAQAAQSILSVMSAGVS